MLKQNRHPKIVLGITSSRSLKLLEGFGDYMADRGWEVHLVSSPLQGKLPHIGKNITLHEVPMSRRPAPFSDLSALVDWVQVLNTIKPDVVSAGTPKAGMLAMTAAFLTRVPRRTYHLRGLRLETEDGLRFKILRWVEKFVGAVSTDILAISPSLREQAVSLGVASAYKIRTVGKGSSNGIDLEKFNPVRSDKQKLEALRRRLGLSENLPVIGFIGRVTRDKGVFELAEASRLLHEREVAHQLLVIGPQELANDRNPWDRADLQGALAPVVIGRVDNVQDYYHLMDVLALPTYREGMGNVLLEAGACGLPAVTTSATGARDAVVDDVTGFQVSIGDPDGLAAALGKLLTNPELRRSMGRNAVEYVSENFARAQVWQGLAHYYEREL